jgi:hypothetical protein
MLPTRQGGKQTMEIDRTTKAILALIALGLWANAVPRLIHPAAAADNEYVTVSLGSIVSSLSKIESSLSKIEIGGCFNSKICGGLSTP